MVNIVRFLVYLWKRVPQIDFNMILVSIEAPAVVFGPLVQDARV